MSEAVIDESGGGRYPFREIEKKWQARWAEAKVHKACHFFSISRNG